MSEAVRSSSESMLATQYSPCPSCSNLDQISKSYFHLSETISYRGLTPNLCFFQKTCSRGESSSLSFLQNVCRKNRGWNFSATGPTIFRYSTWVNYRVRKFSKPFKAGVLNFLRLCSKGFLRQILHCTFDFYFLDNLQAKNEDYLK